VIVGLEFNDAFDLTAIGTLALAVVTFGSLLFAARALAQTKEEIEVSRREVEEAHRPVVVPATDSKPGAAPLSVRIENIGTGPALHIEGRALLLTVDGNRAGHGGEPASIGTVALGASSFGEIQLATEGWTEKACFELTLTYADVAGKRWQTTARYLIDASVHQDWGHYESVEIQSVGTEIERPGH
jgi:hypothetical protein